jgi:hypothetical protein
LQLPTGSGKTLVGVLIGEWLRRKNQEHVVYLCPTKQLVNQVVEQCEEKYGLTVLGFTGSAREYGPTEKADYQNASRIAITTYSSLFNRNSFFKNADVIIVDDVQAAENYIAATWSLKIERTKESHVALHQALCNILKSKIDPSKFRRLSGQWDDTDKGWVDKLSTPDLISIKEQIIEVCDEHAQTKEHKYEWERIREHLHACHLYMSTNEILIRPLIPPTWTNPAFENARQRIYMSATLGAGGDLERLTGRRSIKRLPISEGWDRQGVGRRFFYVPWDVARRTGNNKVTSESNGPRWKKRRVSA